MQLLRSKCRETVATHSILMGRPMCGESGEFVLIEGEEPTCRRCRAHMMIEPWTYRKSKRGADSTGRSGTTGSGRKA